MKLRISRTEEIIANYEVDIDPDDFRKTTGINPSEATTTQIESYLNEGEHEWIPTNEGHEITSSEPINSVTIAS